MRFVDMSPGQVRRFALLGGIAGLVLFFVVGYFAVRNEATDNAGIRYHRGEKVTREESPDKFRSATNLLWTWSGFWLIVSVAGFVFYRRLDDCVEEHF